MLVMFKYKKKQDESEEDIYILSISLILSPISHRFCAIVKCVLVM